MGAHRAGRAAVEQSSATASLASYQDNTLRHIGSPNYFRYGDWLDDDLQVGHGIGYPYFEPQSAADLNNPGAINPPNRLRWTRYMPSDKHQ